ncbi:class I SAM-dependent methyltransferase [Thiocapsa bogorovii]|uniref:class I SAM-dependent methyltransferase n=1 Tax=Thiocapsa bogorovii TaxID=521689 RepID=UPI001E4C2C1E|nr:methyltransferase domain-containing protein [Thiocapsa bogorovii]UHD16246.1 class I SAM-dependent methyltransferase [Thiocapsa bogorovii]
MFTSIWASMTTMNMLINMEDALAYTRCPDCGGNLETLETSRDTGFLCPACNLVFATVSGVLILLDTASRNKNLEGPLIKRLAEQVSTAREHDACKATLGMLDGLHGSAYVWEDEEHWSNEYEQQHASRTEKNWNDRFWQRQPMFQLLVDSLQHAPRERPAVVLDLGCGEGQDFRRFVAPVMREEDIYIGLDISLPGLVLNRHCNTHKHAIYILGTADKPPLRHRLADAVIALGTLHHMQAKEDGLPIVGALLKRGVVLLSDPINGHFLPPFLSLSRESRSAHDDSVDVQRLHAHVQALGFETLYERQFSGLVYVVLFKLFRAAVLRSRGLHGFIHKLDDTFTSTFGRLGNIFRPRGLLLVLKAPPQPAIEGAREGR